jgi:hypothetical protein
VGAIRAACKAIAVDAVASCPGAVDNPAVEVPAQVEVGRSLRYCLGRVETPARPTTAHPWMTARPWNAHPMRERREKARPLTVHPSTVARRTVRPWTEVRRMGLPSVAARRGVLHPSRRTAQRSSRERPLEISPSSMAPTRAHRHREGEACVDTEEALRSASAEEALAPAAASGHPPSSLPLPRA